MHRHDWMGSGTTSHMRKQFESIGRAMEAGIGKRFFGVDDHDDPLKPGPAGTLTRENGHAYASMRMHGRFSPGTRSGQGRTTVGATAGVVAVVRPPTRVQPSREITS